MLNLTTVHINQTPTSSPSGVSMEQARHGECFFRQPLGHQADGGDQEEEGRV